MKDLAIIVGPNRIGRDLGEVVLSHRKTVLFEPLPDACEFMAEQVRDCPGVTIIQAACGLENEKANFNVYNENGASSSLGTCTSEAQSLYDGYDLSRQAVIEVNVINLGDWLTRNGIERIDTLVTDAQGMDLTIAKTIESWFSRSLVGTAQFESDGGGFRMYDGLPDNSEEGFDAFFAEYPQYQKSKLPDRVPWNPDLVWTLEK